MFDNEGNCSFVNTYLVFICCRYFALLYLSKELSNVFQSFLYSKVIFQLRSISFSFPATISSHIGISNLGNFEQKQSTFVFKWTFLPLRSRIKVHIKTSAHENISALIVRPGHLRGQWSLVISDRRRQDTLGDMIWVWSDLVHRSKKILWLN